MTTRRIELGPTARAVAANLRRLRKARGLSLRALSAEVKKGGWTLSADAINKIENGQAPEPGAKQIRRADVDDLMALARALQVPPLTLLLPRAERTVGETSGNCRLQFSIHFPDVVDMHGANPQQKLVEAIRDQMPNLGCAVLHTDQQGQTVPCPGQHPDPEPDTPSEGHPEPPPEQTEEQQLRDRLEVAEYTLRRVREAVSIDTPAEAQLELERVNAVLRANGFEYPLGARGVRDMATQRQTFLDVTQTAEARVTALEAALADVLRQFVHKTHPGRACLQTGHVYTETVEKWRAVLNGKAATP